MSCLSACLGVSDIGAFALNLITTSSHIHTCESSADSPCVINLFGGQSYFLLNRGVRSRCQSLDIYIFPEFLIIRLRVGRMQFRDIKCQLCDDPPGKTIINSVSY